MATQFERFKGALEKMLMLDQAALDFGIYRIINQKRADIEKYLNNELKKQVAEAVSGSSSVPQGSQASSAYGSSPTASSSPVHINNMFSGIANALNAYATLQNQKFVDDMYDSLQDYRKYNNNRFMKEL